MEKAYQHNEDRQNLQVNEDDSAMRFYASQEEQELARLRENLSLSATERFYKLTNLMKAGQMMKKAIIHHRS